MSCCTVVSGQRGEPTIYPGALVQFFSRTVAAAVSPPIPAWDVLAPYYGRWRAPMVRIPGDVVGLFDALQWVTLAAGQSGGESMWVGDPLPEGIELGGARAWMIGRAGTITGATVRPWIGLRVFDESGTILRATPLALGEHGDGTNMNANGTRLWAGDAAGGPVLGAYRTQRGDRFVWDLGFQSADPGTANAGWGTIAPGAGNEYALHVMSTAAEGVNPGSRAPYAEIVGATLP